MTKVLAIASVIGLLSAGTGWMATIAADTTRPDCPGTIVCPQTGEMICRDQCPVMPSANTVAKGDDEKQNNVVAPTGPAPLTDGCCR